MEQGGFLLVNFCPRHRGLSAQPAANGTYFVDLSSFGLPLRRLFHDRARLSDRFRLVYISVARKPVDFFAAVCKAERAVEVVLVAPSFKQALSLEPLQIG